MSGLKRIGMTIATALLATSALAADQRTIKLNQNAVGLLAAETQWMPDALEIADAIQHDDNLRILPIAGIGAVQAVNDLAFLQSVDVALIPADTVTYARLQGLSSGLDGKIAYVARLAEIEFVLIAKKDIGNITALAGKRIATGPAQTAAFASGELLLGMMEVPFLRVPRQGGAALNALGRGYADAALVTTQDLAEAKLNRDKFHVLSIPVPTGLDDTYASSILTADDAPGLLSRDETVDTVSTSLAAAVFNWPKRSENYNKLRRFSAALFAAGGDITREGHATNLAALIPGWQRHGAAEEALAAPAPASTSATLREGDGQ